MWKQRIILGALLTAAVTVFVVVSRDSGGPVGAADRAMANFQQQIGGVGLGAIVVPAWNFVDYDPRLQPVAADNLYPIPGGYSYSPDRLAMVSGFREPPPR